MIHNLFVIGIACWLLLGPMAAQPQLIQPLLPGHEAQPLAQVELQGDDYFLWDAGEGLSLYRLPAAGTGLERLMAWPAPAPAGRALPHLASLDGFLYFVLGASLWRSDGSPAGTQPLYTLPAETGYDGPPQLRGTLVLEGGLYTFSQTFGTDSSRFQLLQLEGSQLRPVFTQMSYPQPGDYPIATLAGWAKEVRGKLVFALDLEGYRQKLLAYHPGTGMTDLLEGGTFFSHFDQFASLPGGKLGFIGLPASNPNQSTCLWVTDGTAEGTGIALHPEPIDNDGFTTFLGSWEGKLFAETASIAWGSSSYTYELRAFDGQQRSLLFQHQGGKLWGMALAQGFLFLHRDLSGQLHWYLTDGTPTGTRALPEVPAVFRQQLPLAGFQGRFLAWGQDQGLYLSDGTTAGTQRLASELSDLVVFPSPENRVYFQATHPMLGAELWLTDGTAPGTQWLADLNPGPHGSSPAWFAPKGANGCFFIARNPGYGLFWFDGQRPYIRDFTLIDGQHDTELGLLSDGDLIDLDQLPSNRLNLRANTVPWEIGSVVYELNGQFFRNENNPPYCLTGSSKRAPYNYYYLTAGPGAYQVTATPYSSKAGGGTAFEPAEVSFQVIGGNSLRQALTTPVLSPNPAPGALQLDWPEAAGQPVDLRVYNAQGKLVLFSALPADPAGQHKVQLYSLPEGIYLLDLQAGPLRISERVIIQR